MSFQRPFQLSSNTPSNAFQRPTVTLPHTPRGVGRPRWKTGPNAGRACAATAFLDFFGDAVAISESLRACQSDQRTRYPPQYHIVPLICNDYNILQHLRYCMSRTCRVYSSA
jgi:hypothetical protein